MCVDVHNQFYGILTYFIHNTTHHTCFCIKHAIQKPLPTTPHNYIDRYISYISPMQASFFTCGHTRII